jgi:hypothetical protein
MSQPSDQKSRRNEAAATATSESDLALVLAICAWSERAGQAGKAASALALERYAAWLDPAWTDRLRSRAERTDSSGQGSLDLLRRMHAQSARVDLSCVHSSWLARALKEESPAVQRAVAANVSPSLRNVLQSELLLDSSDLATERAPAPEVLRSVMTLWTERLVGSEQERSDDDPVVSAVTGFSPRSGYCLCRLMGLAKRVLAAGGTLDDSSRSPKSRERALWFSTRLAGAEVELTALAAKDVRAVAAVGVPHRHADARIGLTTIARLLAATEPVRLRWALQHWPYPLAKVIRLLMAQTPNRPPWLSRGESLILQAARERLELERKLTRRQ